MSGILELFALLKITSGIGFLAIWREQFLAGNVNDFRPPLGKVSSIDKFVPP
jgi:hypothetical protein